ncbi:MAG: cyclic 2,3-diphosphoglycerate synthase [Candidatus Thermoplasmatota archaeon]|nr:cyclic 2,3-diphosphoglycerate synthase [Candidatus Thermoplasmatota archaeon]
MVRTRTVILGAAGRDFHNFNVFFRDNENYEVVAFTATQIPWIDDKTYPAQIAGKLYPSGIPIKPEDELETIIRDQRIDLCVLAYSDLSYQTVMQKASRVNASGADFMLMGHKNTLIGSKKPVIAICASRTGAGKSQTTRFIAEFFKNAGKKVVAIRHPMPYGDLVRQRVQRFATYEDLDKHECTIEEREEYEPHIDRGSVVYAGVDYADILAEAEKEADVILWDGGNNDMPFYKPDLMITVVDPLRPGDETSYYPGETNVRMSDVVIINKIDSAYPEDVEEVRNNVREINPLAVIIDAASPLSVEDPDMIQGKRALIVEDGPTVTHGGMGYGAGYVAALKFGAASIVDPRPFASGSILDTFQKYDHLEDVLPAMGYGEAQVMDLQETINAADCDVVISGTPIDLRRVLKVEKPLIRVRYDLQVIGKPDLYGILSEFMKKM